MVAQVPFGGQQVVAPGTGHLQPLVPVNQGDAAPRPETGARGIQQQLSAAGKKEVRILGVQACGHQTGHDPCGAALHFRRVMVPVRSIRSPVLRSAWKVNR